MNAVALPAARRGALALAIKLEILTIAWMVVEAAASVGAGILARSLLLVAFGVDSLIELASALLLLWRLRLEAGGSHDAARIEAAERTAGRVSGWLLYALAAYVVAAGAWSLLRHESAEASWLGIAVAVVAALVMPLLARRKLALADEIGSGALRADAMETFTCGFLSRVLLVGLILNAVLGWWWLDGAASLVLVPFLVKEAREALSGGCSCHGGEAAPNP